MKIRSTLAVVVIAGLLTACSSPSPASVPDGATEVLVGVGASTSTLPIYVANEEGYFEDNDLDVTASPLPSAAATIPQLINGQVQFSISGVANVAQALQQGLPVKIAAIASVNQTTTDTEFAAIVVHADSSFESMADLATARIAVNDISPAGTFLVDATFEADGVDADPEYLEVRPQEAISAVSRDIADATILYQPILGMALQDPTIRVLTYLDGRVLPGLAQTMIITSSDFAEAAPDAVVGFGAAIERACTFIGENEDEAVEIMGVALERPLDSTSLAECPVGPLTVEAVQKTFDALLKYGVIEKELDAADFVVGVK